MRLSPLVGDCASERSIIGHARRVEIQPAFKQIAVFLDYLCELDHLQNMIGRDGPFGWWLDVEPRHVGLERVGIMRRDLPDRFGLRRRRLLHLVVAGIGVRRQMADIGDVDDVLGRISLPTQHAAQRIGEQEGAHVADMLVIVDRRPAGVEPHLARIDRGEAFDRTGQAVVEGEGRAGHCLRLQTRPRQSHAKGEASLESCRLAV